MKRPSRTPSILSASLHRRLNAYGLAASAAGVGVLALAHPAEAKIVYTKTHKVLYKWNDLVKLDLNHDGIVDFRLGIVHSRYPFYGGELVAFGLSSNTNTVRGSTQDGRWFAAAYPAGVRIGSKKKDRHKGRIRPKSLDYGALMIHGCAASSTSACHDSGTFGNWLNVKNRYLGLAFVVNGKTHYGWARLSAGLTKSGFLHGILTGYAYETVPGKAIITGRTKGSDELDNSKGELDSAALPMPAREPASLGQLALGAPGLSIWKREESVGAVQ